MTCSDTFPRLVINGKPEASDWSVTRRTKNDNSKQGIENPTSADIRCYSSQNAASIAEVPAGATIHYISTQQVNHPGPTQYYLAKVPAGQSASKWDGSGAVWAKFHTEMPTVDKNKQMTWPGQSEWPCGTSYDSRILISDPDEYKTTNATIPKSTPDGEYLLRVEHIALHMAMQANKAQFYLSCSQIKITGGGSGTPGPLVSLPVSKRLPSLSYLQYLKPFEFRDRDNC